MHRSRNVLVIRPVCGALYARTVRLSNASVVVRVVFKGATNVLKDSSTMLRPGSAKTVTTIVTS